MTPQQDRLWAIAIIFACSLLFGIYATYEVLRAMGPEKPETTGLRKL
jgi:hypothetical protein